MTNILTLRLDPRSQAHFEGLRQAHYPAALNQIPAHVSLFHTLPDSIAVATALEAAAAEVDVFPLQVTGLRSLGRGVAYTLASARANTLHAHLAETFADHLTAQDRQRFHAHVVVQNKSTPERARALLAALQAEFALFTVQAEGLDLWHYLGGPWELAQTFPFRPVSPVSPASHASQA